MARGLFYDPQRTALYKAERVVYYELMDSLPLETCLTRLKQEAAKLWPLFPEGKGTTQPRIAWGSDPQYLGFYEPDTHIVRIRQEEAYQPVLLHELTHAYLCKTVGVEGHQPHGKEFVNTYLKVLDKIPHLEQFAKHTRAQYKLFGVKGERLGWR